MMWLPLSLKIRLTSVGLLPLARQNVFLLDATVIKLELSAAAYGTAAIDSLAHLRKVKLFQIIQMLMANAQV
jgi:hypothetical protein